MVGRADELARLRGALEAVHGSSSTQVVTVVGQPGIGKSRLVHEFVRGARVGLDGLPATTVLRTRCLPYGEGITYLPVAELIRAAAGILGDDRPERVLERLRAIIEGLDQGDVIAGHLESLIGVRDEVGAPPDVAWAVRRVFEGLASRQTLTIVVDDIQWAESVLIELLEHIVERARAAPILLVCMARPELEDKPPAWFDDPSAETIRLAPLSTDEGSTLVDELLGGLPLDAAARARIAIAADGNPLFIEQLLAMLTDDGILAREDGRWVARADLGQVAIPPSISALLAARIDRVPVDTRRTLLEAAVVGQVFTPAEVSDLAAADVTPGEALDVGAHLADLVGRELLVTDGRDGTSQTAYRFRHLLVRDAAYGALSKSDRAYLHVVMPSGSRRRTIPTAPTGNSSPHITSNRHTGIESSSATAVKTCSSWLTAQATSSDRPAGQRVFEAMVGQHRHCFAALWTCRRLDGITPSGC